MEKTVLYECENPACPLGTTVQHGVFTGGSTAALVSLITGAPEETLTEGKDFGEGFCPVCLSKGRKVGTHETADSSDPYVALHEKVRIRVVTGDLDPSEAQSCLHELIEAAN
jgi:hypothetical protein